MGKVSIVTDSTAELTPDLAEELGITVIPLHLKLGSETFVDSPDLRTAEFHRRIVRSRVVSTADSPTVQEFAHLYNQLGKETDDIVSIHLSAALNKTVQAARQGSAGLLGRCRIAVMDSQLISRALGILVTEAAQAARDGAEGPEIVRLVRGMIPRLYFTFYVESLEQLRRAGLIHPSRVSVTHIATVKPLLILEEGQITPVQRLHNRGKPTERLFEFVAEFSRLKKLAILHSGVGPEIGELKTQLDEVFPPQMIEEHIFGPVLSTLIGPMALGIAAFEG